MQRVYLEHYREDWAAEFARESAKVALALGGCAPVIHHIGSTAIPGIRAKPIIDMLVEVADLEKVDAAVPAMTALGYESLGEFGIAGRRYFRKDAADGRRTHQIHVFAAGSPQITRHIAFRDFLRGNPDKAVEYDTLKADLAARFPSDISAYTDGKDEFIREIDALAANLPLQPAG